VALVLVGLTALFQALVVRSIWNWHVVPVFHMRTLILGHALGLICLVAAIKYRGKGDSEPLASWSDLAGRFLSGILLFAFLWLLAWIGLQIGTKG
jgi:hypothetical protein